MDQATRDKHNLDLMFEATRALRHAIAPNTPIIKIDEACFVSALHMAVVQQDVATLEKIAYDCRKNQQRLDKLRLLVKRMEINTRGYAI